MILPTPLYKCLQGCNRYFECQALFYFPAEQQSFVMLTAERCQLCRSLNRFILLLHNANVGVQKKYCCKMWNCLRFNHSKSIKICSLYLHILWIKMIRFFSFASIIFEYHIIFNVRSKGNPARCRLAFEYKSEDAAIRFYPSPAFEIWYRFLLNNWAIKTKQFDRHNYQPGNRQPYRIFWRQQW